MQMSLRDRQKLARASNNPKDLEDVYVASKRSLDTQAILAANPATPASVLDDIAASAKERNKKGAGVVCGILNPDTRAHILTCGLIENPRATEKQLSPLIPYLSGWGVLKVCATSLTLSSATREKWARDGVMNLSPDPPASEVAVSMCANPEFTKANRECIAKAMAADPDFVSLCRQIVSLSSPPERVEAAKMVLAHV